MSSQQSLTIDELIETFDSLGDWEAQCEYLIDLGLDLPDFPADQRIEQNRVHGCQSNVWLIADVRQNGQTTVEIQADSDSMIVRGLIAVLLAAYSGRKPEEILSTDIKALFSRLGLDRHLSPQRKNGLFGMVQRVRKLAEAAA
ncbi:MAG: SufE family protein [Planctomycetaceae bacterium]